MSMEKYKLRGGTDIPQIGLGTWKINDTDTLEGVIEAAAEQELFLVDTAAAYGNEIVISKALRGLGIPRETMFLQDKLWNTCRGYEAAQEACKKSLKKLKLDYLDAYLVHWPASPRLHDDWREINAETWRGMERLKEEGLVRVIGVCNFKPHHLEELRRTAKEMPEIDQVEFHPGYYPKDILEYCQANGILIQASSPLGNGQILGQPLLAEIAARHGKTTAQICLRWGLDKGIAAVVKTTSPDRYREDRDVFDFSLDGEERCGLDRLAYCGGIGLDPDEVTEFG